MTKENAEREKAKMETASKFFDGGMNPPLD
jgi:hypothetical protein